MALRASSLQSTNTLAINREIGSQYDVILEASKHLVEIDTLANEDINGLINSLNEAKDFTGITVVTGETPSWDAVNKVLTVTTEKGDIGADGRGIVDIELTSTVGLTKTYTINYTDTTSSTFTVINGADGANGVAGKSVYQLWLDAGNVGTLNDFLEAMKGPKGSTGPQGIGIQGPAGVDGQDLTVEQISYNGNGTFTWQFSDGTSYTTPDLRGPQGITGSKGDKGDTGISVHHLKGTSTTNPNGDFGTSPFKDTYTLYGDASETIVLGYFTVANGVSDGMSAAIYDTNRNGVVDNSERLGGELPNYYVNVSSAQSISGDKTFVDNVVVQGNFTVNGTSTTVDTENILIKDNTIIVNSGEAGAGVTAGEAGIIVDRGTATDYKFVFDEVSDSFKVGETGSLQKVATREDTPINGGVAVWDNVGYKFVTTQDPSVNSVSVNGHLVSWNSDESTLDVSLNGATLQVGQEQLIRVRNNSSVSIANGMAVMATGTIGNSGRITVDKANLTQANAKYILGIVTETIDAGADGFCTTFGKIRGIQTNGAQYGETWLDGDVLYVKDSGNGALTKVVPTDSQVKLPVAIVISSHATNGTLFVRVNSIDENHAKEELASKVDKNAAIVGGTATKITYDAKGLVTRGTTLIAPDIPDLDASKITSGILPVVRGGTGTSTSTGSGSVVLSVSPTLVTPVLGVATGTSFNSITGLSSTSPNMDGVASAGTAVTVARGDHTHPTDTSRQAAITGAATTITSANLTVSRTLVSDTNGKVVVSNVTAVELGYLSGVTSSVQTQINSKAPLVSPTFTGTPVAPTASVGTSTTQIATTAYVIAEINKIEEW